jgi:hypothetical protein
MAAMDYKAANFWHMTLYTQSHIMAGIVCLKTGNTLCKLNFKTHFGNPEIVFMNIHEHTRIL